MGRTAFSHELRVLTCDNCGAPLEVLVAGGSVACGYCKSVNQCLRRDESDDLAKAQQAKAQALSESERLAILRRQDNVPMERPPSLDSYLAGGGFDASQQQAALSDWLQMRKRAQAGAGAAEADRFFHLTLLLSPELEARHERALLENAVEALADARHRQVLRCRLAQLAVLAGEGEAAYQWLAPCNPYATDLLMDTAFRLASSCLASAAGAFDKVRLLLGERPGDVPIADDYDDHATVLRANALEQQGRVQEATQQLLDTFRQDPRALATVRDFVTANASLRLCPVSYRDAEGAYWAVVQPELQAGSPPPSLGCIVPLVVVILAGAAVVVGAHANVWSDLVVEGRPFANQSEEQGMAWLVTCLTIVPIIVVVSKLYTRARALRLRANATRGFAQLIACRTNVVQNKNSTVTYQQLTLKVPAGGAAEEINWRMQSDTPVSLGVYPCLYDPSDPSNLLLKVR